MTVPRFAVVLALVALVAAGASAAAGDKQLARVRGTVQYQLSDEGPLTKIFGSLALPDDAVAVTLADSRGLLRLADSSESTSGRARACVSVRSTR